MSEPFNVNQYWLERGQGYVREGLAHEFHLLQERFLLEILRASRLPMGRLLEIGCGFGRITRLLAETFADAHITAVDLSPDQLLNARSYCRLSPNISFQLFDIYSGAPFPAADYDTVVAVEVFLHHPAPVVASLVERLSRVTQHLVNKPRSTYGSTITARSTPKRGCSARRSCCRKKLTAYSKSCSSRPNNSARRWCALKRKSN